MNLEGITVEIRPRSPWEAMDIGHILARRWYGKLCTLWIAAALPFLGVFLLLSLFLPGSVAKWSLLLFWFFKPLYEPLLILWISRALFGKRYSLKETWTELRGKNSIKELFYFSFLRLNLCRSFAFPVVILEGLQGKKKRERMRVLQDGFESYVLQSASFLLEILFTLSGMSVFYWLIPENLRWIDFGSFVFTADSWVILVAYCISSMLVAPFYVSSGFMMYLSRRVQLEAWDIEIGFKRIRQRILARKKKTAQIVTVGVMLFSSISLFQQPLSYANNEVDKNDAKYMIKQVLERKEFGQEVSAVHWVPKKKEERKEEPAWIQYLEHLLKKFGGYIEKLQPVIGKFGKFVLFVIAALLIIIVLAKFSTISRWFGLGLSSGKKRRDPPDVLFGMDLRPESLPDDIGAVCLQLIRDNKKREALGLLYRGTLSVLVNTHYVDIRSSFTENECSTEVIKGRSQEESSFFSTLTSHWIAAAYRHKEIDADECHILIHHWEKLYGAER